PVDLPGPGEALDGLVPLAGLAGHLAELVFTQRVRRINLQLFFELASRLFLGRRVLRAGQESPSEAIMDARQIGVRSQYLAVFLDRLLRLALELQDLGVHLVGLDGAWRD